MDSDFKIHEKLHQANQYYGFGQFPMNNFRIWITIALAAKKTKTIKVIL